MEKAASVAQIVGRLPGVIGTVEAFIAACQQPIDARHRAAFLRMMRNLHGVFAAFIKSLPEEENFLDLCGDAYDSWHRGR